MTTPPELLPGQEAGSAGNPAPDRTGLPVGNFGDSRHAYGAATVGRLQATIGVRLSSIDGGDPCSVSALGPSADTLFFTAGPNDEQNGVCRTITETQVPTKH